MRKLLSHIELDQRLEAAAECPEVFGALVEALVAELDRQDADLEISDPQSWRRGSASSKTSFAQQFRADVDNLIPLTRRDEGRLARRIEFARLRMERAQASEGPRSRRLVRRATELHALRSEMVERNLYLVLINVERYSHAQSSRMDLIQEGSCALFRAVDGFDWRRGLLFRTYAVHWLNQAFRNYLYNHGHTVRVPVYLQKALKGINQAASRIGDAGATADEIAAEANLSESVVSTAISASRATLSLDADRADEGARLKDLLVDSDHSELYAPEIEEVSLEGGLGRAMEGIGPRERLVLSLRFGIGVEREHTLAEVAGLLGVSVERVRQIQVRALGKLGTPSLRRELEPFLN